MRQASVSAASPLTQAFRAPTSWSPAHGLNGFTRRNLPFLYQPADRGALPTLYAATAQDAQGGAYDGPTSSAETRGEVGLAKIPPAAADAQAAARL